MLRAWAHEEQDPKADPPLRSPSLGPHEVLAVAADEDQTDLGAGVARIDRAIVYRLKTSRGLQRRSRGVCACACGAAARPPREAFDVAH